MSSSINEVSILGNIGNDPEIRKSQFGEFAVLSVATEETRLDKNQKKIKEVEWHRVAVFIPAIVDLIKNHLRKGDQVYIKGGIYTSKIEKEDQKPQYVTQITVKNHEHFLRIISTNSNKNQTN